MHGSSISHLIITKTNKSSLIVVNTTLYIYICIYVCVCVCVCRGEGMGCGESSVCRRPLQRIPALHRPSRHIQRTRSQSQWRLVYLSICQCVCVRMCPPPSHLLIKCFDSKNSPPSVSPSSLASKSPCPLASASSLLCLVYLTTTYTLFLAILLHTKSSYIKWSVSVENQWWEPLYLLPLCCDFYQAIHLCLTVVERYQHCTSSWVDLLSHVLYLHFNVEGVTVRIDTGVCEGATISMHYDPMISKLCTHAPTRYAKPPHCIALYCAVLLYCNWILLGIYTFYLLMSSCVLVGSLLGDPLRTSSSSIPFWHLF